MKKQLTNDEKIAQLLKDRRRYMNNASRDRRRVVDHPNAVGPFGHVWEKAVIDCERELTGLGWISPPVERRIVRILLGQSRNEWRRLDYAINLALRRRRVGPASQA